MFEDSLIESGGRLKTKRGWTSIVSFAIQMMIIGVMVLIPLIFTEALPKGQMMFSGGPPAASAASTASRRGRAARKGDSDRHRERGAAHAHQDSANRSK